MPEMPSEKTMSKASENRRSTKPIMEKRRRARINNSLSELKNLILDALKKDNARHSKLEKADILEMTVRHLRTLQRTPPHSSSPTDQDSHQDSLAQYRSGFSECAREVSRFLDDLPVRQRLLAHLASCLDNLPSRPPVSSRLQLVPTRLPSGDIAFLLPASAVYTPVSPVSSTSSLPSDSPVVHSSGILSPATSDRCSSPATSNCFRSPSPRYASPSPHYTSPSPHFTSPSPHYNSPSPHYTSPSPHYTSPSPNFTSPVVRQEAAHCTVIVPAGGQHRMVEVQSKSVWRPF